MHDAKTPGHRRVSFAAIRRGLLWPGRVLTVGRFFLVYLFGVLENLRLDSKQVIRRTKEQGELPMAEREWEQFAATGKVADYLAYSRVCQTEHGTEGVGDRKESEGEHGADHCAYRYGSIGDTHGGL